MAKIIKAGAAYCNEETGNKWGLKVDYDDDTFGWLFFDTMEEMSDARDEIDRKLWGGRGVGSVHRDLPYHLYSKEQWHDQVQEVSGYWEKSAP